MDTILSTGAPPPSLPLALDHLVVAARTLDEGERWLTPRLGRPLVPGGSHPGFGTHNRLLRLGDGCYLELIAPDPAQAVRGLLFGLDRPRLVRALAASPLLLHVVMRVVAPATLEDVVPQLAYDPGLPTAMARGGLHWQITISPHGQLPGDGLLPTIIDWGDAAHPCTRLPDSGVVLRALRWTGPAASVAAFPVLAPAHSADVVLETGTASCSTICAEFTAGGKRVIIESALPGKDLP